MATSPFSLLGRERFWLWTFPYCVFAYVALVGSFYRPAAKRSGPLARFPATLRAMQTSASTMLLKFSVVVLQ
jgi:hypothetical protein